jgi:glucokinase
MTADRIVAGVDLGGTKIYSVAATLDGAVLGEDRRPTEAALGPDAVIERTVASLRAALEAAGVGTDRLLGAGISAPGPLDQERGVVIDAPNLRDFRNVPLGARVGEALGVPTVLENDANAACYGEYRFGAGRGHRHVVYLTLGTGIGGGLILDRRLYRGASGSAGEVGHMILIEDGPACNCGSRGCLEAISSGPAIARDAAEAVAQGRAPVLAELAAGRPVTAELAGEAAERGDAAAREVIERAGYFLGLALAGLLNVFNPDALILGGGLIGLGDRYLQPARRTARERAFPNVVADATIALAELGGERAGALGASALVPESTAR